MPAKIIKTDEQVSQWVMAYTVDKRSTRDIARSEGISFQTVCKFLRAKGVVLSAGERISKKNTGRKWKEGRRYTVTDEDRANRKARMTGNKYCAGRKLSEDSRQRMREAMLARSRRWREEAKLRPLEVQTQLESIRQSCKRFVRRVLEATGKRKQIPSEKYLGYTKHDLLSSIGPRPEGHDIDHKVPIAEFFRRGIYDVAVINAIVNLHWLPTHDNKKKSAKVPYDVDEIVSKCMRQQNLTAHFSNGKVSYTQGVA